MAFNLGRRVSVQALRPAAPEFNRAVEGYPNNRILGRLQNCREHLLATRTRQHEYLLYFQNGEGDRVVGLGFPQARGGTCGYFRKISRVYIQCESESITLPYRRKLPARRCIVW